jgi:hypothetical protein
MPTTSVAPGVRDVDATWRDQELPPLTAVDRLALRAGVALILWGRRHALVADRREQARRAGTADVLDRERTAVLERRLAAGPVR